MLQLDFLALFFLANLEVFFGFKKTSIAIQDTDCNGGPHTVPLPNCIRTYLAIIARRKFTLSSQSKLLKPEASVPNLCSIMHNEASKSCPYM